MTPPLLHIDKQGSSSAFRGRNSSSPDGVAQQRDVRPLDHRTLEKELRAVIEGEVRFDEGSRALYATDGSNYRQVPIGVVIPRHAEDVVRAIAVARDHGAPVLSRGGGTSLAGQCCNEAVVLDFSKYMHGIWELNPQAKRARIQPGIVLDALREAAERHHLTFGPDPSTHTHCTLGGMIGNNSCGVHSVMAGETSDNVEELEILTYDGLRLRVGSTGEQDLEHIIAAGGRQGQIYRDLRSLRDRYADLIRAKFPALPRRVSGYNLPALLPEGGFHVAKALVGSESTCVTILEATVRLVDSPQQRSLLVLGYPSVYEAGDHIPDILEYHPIGLEGMDDRLVDDMIKMRIHPEDVRLLPSGEGWLLAEFGGDTKDEADARARRCMEALKAKGHPPSMKLFDKPAEEKIIWTVRESGLGATAHVPGEHVTWEGWEDSAVPVDRLGAYLRALRALFDKYRYGCALYGHFGQGCVHTRIDFDLKTREGIRTFRRFLFDAADLVLGFGGSLSGEHGDGQSRAELLPKMFGPELVRAFEEFKSIWDPAWKMNPGKIVRPYRVDENLRLGPDYHPPQPRTHFQFPGDGYSFAQATLRCVGVGECRREHGKTMCPSYRVTKEEMHSTRGRARLLFEMLEGDPVRHGWRDPHVKESLDLCLACKGCKVDCPVNVDMASYKAEFLSHYYEGRWRPRAAYSMGWIHLWARLASFAPSLANWFTQTPGIRSVMKAAAGISPHRRMPPFAATSFVQWHRAHERKEGRQGEGRPVLLWPDTFNNYFLPETAVAATEVIEAAGFRAVIPRRPLCCGRPLYDFGFLDQAKRQLQDILRELSPAITSGLPMVVLEPSCAAVFRDELINLFPHDEQAKRLSQQTYNFAEFAEKYMNCSPLTRWRQRAVVHGHCHQKAVMGMNAEHTFLQRLSCDAQMLDSGCCGMAGSFGFKAEHYATSVQVGQLALLPAVEGASPDAVIVADGFSCREQIEQLTDRRALHLAQLAHLAMQDHRKTAVEPAASYPERGYLKRNRLREPLSVFPTRLALGTVCIALGLAAFLMRRKTKR
jgi:FAD/FMN-containing dehydrogenase/Fe-S oxidoreductase